MSSGLVLVNCGVCGGGDEPVRGFWSFLVSSVWVLFFGVGELATVMLAVH